MSAATETTVVAGQTAAETRPLYWLVRRELWEHRSLIWTPVIVGVVILCGFILNALQLPHGVRMLAELDPGRQRQVIAGFHGMIAIILVITMGIVAWFYALDALYSERRDRSILFWKSLPVSDTATVLSKLLVLMAVVPAITFVVTLAVQILVLLISTITLLFAGESAALLWSNLPPPGAYIVAFLYTLALDALWLAPIYGWLLLVSAWSRRQPFLWSVLPLAAVMIFERIAFDTGHFGRVLARQVGGAFQSFAQNPGIRFREGGVDATSVELLNPGTMLAEPQLWIGLVVAAGLIAATVWMRRYREPI